MSHQAPYAENDASHTWRHFDLSDDRDGLAAEVLGTLDELSCWIGVLIATGSSTPVKQLLALTQHDLIDLMVQIKLPGSPLLSSKHLSRIEDGLRLVKEHIEPPVALTLPGGLPVAAFAHLARSICKRAERRLYSLAELNSSADAMLGETKSTAVGDDRGLTYLKRLSELLLLISRLENHEGRADIRWDPAKAADTEAGK